MRPHMSRWLLFYLVAVATILYIVQATRPTSAATPPLGATLRLSAPLDTSTPTPTLVPTWPTPLTCAVFHGSITNSDPTVAGRLNLIEGHGDCSIWYNPCPGVADAVPRHYDVYSFVNLTSFYECVVVTLEAPSCSGNNAIYSASFYEFDNIICDPFHGFQAGVVTSPGGGTYSFQIPCCARGQYSIFVQEVNPGAGCSDYTITIHSGPTCATQYTIPTVTQTRTPTSTPTYTSTPTATYTHTTVVMTPTPTSTPTCGDNYTYTVSSGVIVPGVNLVPGSQCGGCVVGITLPFAFNFYGQTYTTANLSVQGNIQFTTSYLATPVATACPFPEPRLGPAILPYWDLSIGTGWHTSCQEYIGSPCGVYTSVTGIAPDRIFNVEWRTQYFATSQHTAQFEVRLHEGTNTIDFLYAHTSYPGWHAAIGLQDGNTRSVTYACYVQSGSTYPGLQISWTPPLCGPPTPTPTNTPVPGCILPWNIVNSPTTWEGVTPLYGVSAISASDIWAAGQAPYSFGPTAYTLHWDGTQWITYTTATAPGSFPVLRGVSALAGNDVWAVGYSTEFDNVSRQYLLTVHWDGSQWSVVPSPNPGGNGANYLSAVKAIASNDVWAVGYFGDLGGGNVRALFLHWNGSSWGVVQGSDPAGLGRRLYGIAEVAANDMWAGGVYNSRSALFHWNGASWTDVPVPDIGQVNGLSALAANDVWAVGDGGTLHWNGSAWSLITSPVLPLYSVQALSPADAWAVGAGRQLAHWNGAWWEAVPNPIQAVLNAVTAAAPTKLWAVGYQISPVYGTHSLTERADGACDTPTATPTGNSTSTSTPTGTRTATITPFPTNATATPCTITFIDVFPTDYFYEAVRYLYCHGVISGYGDGTFRPYNNTTRGQLTKIVSLAVGFPTYTPPAPTFQDVPADHPFYTYIETAYHQGIISGYTCGPGCLEFRPSSNVTRGQVCKIVVLAEQWALYSPPSPTFRDVSQDNPFYAHIETAYSHDIISGYNCGAGCLEFRPGGDATRGQISKIVYMAVTPP